MLLTVCACRNKKQVNNVEPATTISGLYLRDVNADAAGTVGTPDTRNDFGGRTFFGYPNPCNGMLQLYVKLPLDASVTIYTKAVQYAGADANDVGNQSIFSEPLTSIGTYSLTSGNNGLQVNTASYLKGYYRFYMVVGSDTLTDNIWVKH